MANYEGGEGGELQAERAGSALDLIQGPTCGHPKLVTSSRMPCQCCRVRSYRVRTSTMMFRTVAT